MVLSLRKDADVAQVVAHLIGSEEVTGPSPVISFTEACFQGFLLVYKNSFHILVIHMHKMIIIRCILSKATLTIK